MFIDKTETYSFEKGWFDKFDAIVLLSNNTRVNKILSRNSYYTAKKVSKCVFIAIFINHFALEKVSKRKKDTESGAYYIRMLFVKLTESGILGQWIFLKDIVY